MVSRKEVSVPKILQLESTVQIYVGYWINKYASLAKRGKNSLFDKNKIEELLSKISSDRVIEAITVYDKISEVLTMYRKVRRNHNKTEFSEFLGVDKDDLLRNIDSFRYMNTVDIILLNAYANLKEKYKELSVQVASDSELIIDSIMLVREFISQDQGDVMSLITNNASVFKNVQNKIACLQSRYNWTL